MFGRERIGPFGASQRSREIRHMKTATLLAPSAFVALMPGRLEAHVKWFSEFSFADRPLSFLTK